MIAPRDEELERILAARARILADFASVRILELAATLFLTAAAFEASEVALRERLVQLGMLAQSARPLVATGAILEAQRILDVLRHQKDGPHA